MSELLSFVPEQASYGVAHPDQVISVELDGGSPRLRADRLNAAGAVSASWLLERAEYTEFLYFFRKTLERGSLPFRVDMILDLHLLTRYRCTLVPGSLRTTMVAGLTYRVTAELRVEQLVMETNFMDFLDPDGIHSFLGSVFDEILVAGDQIQLVGAQVPAGAGPALNLDGFYEVATVVDAQNITLDTPSSINSDWSLIASWPGGNAPDGSGTIANVTVIKTPS
jgi:hypothetical protein